MKKTRKKGIRSLAILLALILAIGFSPVTNVEAKAAPRLNYRKVTLVQGKKKRLKVRNLSRSRRRKVKWYSTRKSVATVNRKGVVKAKRKGKAYIVAKVGRKKYRCKVIVKKKVTKKKKKTKKSKKPVGNTKKQLPADSIDKWSVLDQPTLAVNSKTDLFNYLTVFGKKINVVSNSVKIKYYKWESSNTSKLVINKYGIATGKKPGTVKITCSYLTRSGKWCKTTSSVTVVETNDVKVSYSIDFDEALAVNSHYETYNTNELSNRFNVLNLFVSNNSSEAMIFNNYVAFGLTSTSVSFNFQTVNKQKVTIPPHSTKVIKFVPGYYYDIIDNKCPYNFCLNKRDLESLHFSFKTNGSSVYASYFVDSGRLMLK